MVEQTLNAITADILAALPAIVIALAAQVVASVAITVVMRLGIFGCRCGLRPAEPTNPTFVSRITTMLLWFGTA